MLQKEVEEHVESFARYLHLEAVELSNEFGISKQMAVVVINRAMSVYVWEEMQRYRKHERKRKNVEKICKAFGFKSWVKPYELRYSVSYLD